MFRHGFHIPDDAMLVIEPPDPEWADPSCDDMRDSVERIGDHALVIGYAPIDPGWSSDRLYAYLATICPCGHRTEGGECEGCENKPPTNHERLRDERK